MYNLNYTPATYHWSSLSQEGGVVQLALRCTFSSLYLAQQILRLFLSYSVQSGNSAVGLNSYWLIANVF
jgi:hypothetical protein